MRKHIKPLLCAGLTGLAAMSSHAQSYSNAVMALNPVAYYPLNENTAPPAGISVATTNYGSESGQNLTNRADIIYGHPGPLASQPTDTSDYFNGGTAFANATHDTNVSVAPPFTIEGWFLSKNVGATQCPTSDFDSGNASGFRTGWLIYMDISNVGQYSWRGYNALSASPSLTFNIGAPGSIVTNKWYHLVVVVDVSGGTTNVSGYINGALVSGPTVLPSYVPNDGQSTALLSAGFSAGGRADANFLYNGNVDELAFYNTNLSAATILSHYQAATNPAPATAYDQLVLQSNPVLYYRFNESTPPLEQPIPCATPGRAQLRISWDQCQWPLYCKLRPGPGRRPHECRVWRTSRLATPHRGRKHQHFGSRRMGCPLQCA